MTMKGKRGRPSKEIVGKGSHISANLGPERAKALRDWSDESGIPISELVRRAVEKALDEEAKKG
jgi:hypothetical protein